MPQKEDDTGHLLGNFHAYYKFNSTVERLKFLSPPLVSLLQEHLGSSSSTNEESSSILRLWDIGCNEGNLTMGLVKSLEGNTVESSDINRSFRVEALTELNNKMQSEKRDLTYCIYPSLNNENLLSCRVMIDSVFYGEATAPSKKACRIGAASMALKRLLKKETPTDSSVQELISAKSFKSVEALGTDLDRTLVERAQSKCSLPQVQFRTVDAMDVPAMDKVLLDYFRNQKIGFDVITCFSVTMWIHLNHGDEGLFRFLDMLASRTDCLIMELQGWKSYRKAYKRLKRLKKPLPASFMSLQVRENVEERIDLHLKDTGFVNTFQLGQTSWGRNIKVYSKHPISGMSDLLKNN